jgi:hypothetical protein
MDILIPTTSATRRKKAVTKARECERGKAKSKRRRTEYDVRVARARARTRGAWKVRFYLFLCSFVVIEATVAGYLQYLDILPARRVVLASMSAVRQAGGD